MSTIEERVSRLEGRMEEQATAIADLRGLIVALDEKLDRRFEAMDRRFEAVDRRFEAVDRRFDQVDARFRWMVSIQFGIFLTVLAGTFGVIASLVAR